MIKIFRHIRQKLLAENRFSKYLLYAIGEIILVVIGILIALQINNWNEARKKENQFKSTLEELYNKISDDVWFYNFMIRENENIISVTDSLLKTKKNDRLNFTLPANLWYTTIRAKNSSQSIALPVLEKIAFNPEDKKQKKLANQLFSYKELIASKANYSFVNGAFDEIRNELVDNGISFPKFDHNVINSVWVSDSIWYSKEDIKNTKNLLYSKQFRSLLKTAKSQRNFDILDYRAFIAESENILNSIKTYHPDARLLFEDVGIIGTSINGFDDVGAKSTPMVLVDEENSIWEINLYLKKGLVKFRCRDSWAQNWGGSSFPRGEAEKDGNNIEIPEAGNYLITLNLSQKTYHFKKLDD